MSDPRWTWLFTGMGLCSLYLMTRKSRWGFIVGLVKECIWIPYGYTTGQYGFIASGVIFGTMFARGFWRWSHEQQPDLDRTP